MKSKRLFKRRPDGRLQASERSDFNAFLAEGLRTSTRREQTCEQMRANAARSQEAMRERLTEVTRPLVHSKPVPSRIPLAIRPHLPILHLRKLVPAALLLMILVTGSMSMPATGTYNVNLQIKTNDNGVSYIAPSDSVQLDANSSNAIFAEIAEEIGAPCFYLTPYVDSIFCLQKTISPTSQYALVTLMLNNVPFHLSFKTVRSDFSSPIPITMEQLVTVWINAENYYIVYHNTADDESNSYIAYLIQDNFLLSVSASTTLDSFTLFLKNLTIVS